MTHELHATAFRTTMGTRILINVPSMPGIDDQLIAKEDAKMARMQKHLRARMECPATTAERAFMKKLALQGKAHDIIHNPEVCRCAVGKQHCHLNIHHPGNGQVLTRSGVYCTGC